VARGLLITALEIYAPVEQCQAARLYSQLALAVAWQSEQLPLDNLLCYRRNPGDILVEGVVNQSPREQGLVRDNYQRAQHFFQDNPKTTLLEAMADVFEPLAGHNVLVEDGQHALLVFNEVERYQLYSHDTNYAQRFHTRPGVIWAEMIPFAEAFFQWKSGRNDHHVLTLRESLPVKSLAQLQAAAFWQHDKIAPDSVLLARELAELVEGIQAEAVRQLVRV
jgi:hypothetical protein